MAIAVACSPAPDPGPPPPAGACGGPHWVASWGAAQSDAVIPFDATFSPIPGSFGGRTVRNVITPHLGGERVRLHVTNRYNPMTVTFGRVTVGESRPGGGVEAPVAVEFDGGETVTLAPGQDAVSDPLPLDVEPFTPLAVSIHVRSASGQLTKHWASNATTYLSGSHGGDLTGATSGAAFPLTAQSWFGVLALDVEAEGSARAIVALGDSLTDGWVASNPLSSIDRSVSDTDFRYPDVLQRRIAEADLPLSVVNAGLGSNQVLGSIFPIAGPSAVSRFDHDVTHFSSARGVIVFEGINDLGLSGANGAAVIGGLRRLVEQARAAGLHVWLATITPASDAIIDGTFLAPNSEYARRAVNAWIRTQTIADGYFDFDAAVRDPEDPAVLADEYSSVDRLHLSVAGYRRIAEEVDLDALATTTCGPEPEG